MEDKATQEQNENQPPQQYVAGTVPGGHKKLTFAVVIAVVILCLLAGVAAYLVWRNGTVPPVLLESINNTTKLEQMKFHVELSDSADGQGTLERTAVDGVYKKGSGLSASAKDTLDFSGLQTVKDSRWVIDSSGNVYANLASIGTKVVDDQSVYNTPTNVKNMATASQTNTDKNKDVWKKLDATNLAYGYNTYGLQACVLSEFYTVQSSPDTFKSLMSQLAGWNRLNVQKMSSTSHTSTYTISPNPGAVSSLYAKSKLYTSLAKCNKSQYGGTNQSISNVLKKTTMNITIDVAKKLVTSVEIKVKGGSILNATVASTSGVTITVPKVTPAPAPKPGETADSYMQRNMPYVYNNITNINNNYGNKNNGIYVKPMNGLDAKPTN